MVKFIEITNKDIYDEIRKFKKDNYTSHQEIIKHQLKTNGKVSLNRWIATTALTLFVVLLGIVLNNII